MSKSSESDVPRYEGTNWDPVAKVKRAGTRGNVQRKVLTRGVRQICCCGVLKEAVKLLRSGMEVRLVDEGGRDAIRVYPIVSKDCRRVYPQAATMGAFRECLEGKKVRVRHGDREISESETKSLVAEAAARKAEAERNMICVTPDTTVQCPKCGTSFRVGKVLAGRK